MPLHLLQITKKLAHDAGSMALEHLKRGVRVDKKGANDLVTEADKACEKLIIDTIRRNFPSHSILSEEAGEIKGDGEYKWVIDPIDGTTNFAQGIPLFSISIAVIYKGLPIIGVVEVPALKETFWAKKDQGAFLNKRRIHVSTKGDFTDALLSTGFPYDRESPRTDMTHKLYKAFHQKSRGIRRMGSAAMDLAYIAAGRMDGTFHYNLEPWDIAAGKLIVEEAGGMVTDMDGSMLKPKKGMMLASNGVLHQGMIDTIKAEGGLSV